MTNYDEWKTTETFSDEAEFVAKRAEQLFAEWSKDHKRLHDAISDEMADDVDGYVPDALAHFFTQVTVASEGEVDAVAAAKLFGRLSAGIFRRITRDAETAAQAEYDNRLTAPEGDL